MTGLEFATTQLHLEITETPLRVWLSRWETQGDGRTGLFSSLFQLPTRQHDVFAGWARYQVTGNECRLECCMPLWFPPQTQIIKMSATQHGIIVASRKLRQDVVALGWQMVPARVSPAQTGTWLDAEAVPSCAIQTPAAFKQRRTLM